MESFVLHITLTLGMFARTLEYTDRRSYAIHNELSLKWTTRKVGENFIENKLWKYNVGKHEFTMKWQKPEHTIQGAYLMVHCVTWYLRTAHEWALVLVWELLVWLPCCVGDTTDFLSSPPGVGGASFLGGILSLMASSPFASANDVILWFGEKPCRAADIIGFH